MLTSKIHMECKIPAKEMAVKFSYDARVLLSRVALVSSFVCCIGYVQCVESKETQINTAKEANVSVNKVLKVKWYTN